MEKEKINLEWIEDTCIGGSLASLYFDVRDLVKKELKRDWKKRATEKAIDTQLINWIEMLKKSYKDFASGVIVEMAKTIQQPEAYRSSYILFLILLKRVIEKKEQARFKQSYAIVGYYDEDDEHMNLEVREIRDNYQDIERKKKKAYYMGNGWIDDGVYLMLKIED